MAEKDEINPCECCEIMAHLVRNLDEARKLIRENPARALFHADFAREEMPKVESCLLVDLSDAKERLGRAREIVDRREEAKKLIDLAWSSFFRRLRQCAER